MVYDLQKAGLWKRIAAWMFDGILTGILAVAFGVLLSMLLGYDGYSQTLNDAYAHYEAEYGVVFDISAETYGAMTPAEQDHYNAAYAALIHDMQAMRAYNMVKNLSLVIASMGILLAILLWEFAVPLWIGNGQTLGKKIFGLCLMRNDGVKVNNLQLFTRTILGKFTVETMIPVYIAILIFLGSAGMGGTLVILALLLDLVCAGLVSKLFSEYVYPIPPLPGMLQAVLAAMIGAAMLLWLVLMPVPLFSVTVRRLHDVGMSGKWMLGWIILNAAPMLFTLSALANGEPFWALVSFAILPTILGKLLCGLFGQPEAEAVVALALTLIWGIADFLLSFFLLIYFIGKGDNGTNEYGPAPQP